MSNNVLDTPLEDCCLENDTGFFRDGRCDDCELDPGQHIVCAVMTDEFLKFSKDRGNDLTVPVEEFDFPGLKAGDQWCICLERWIEALEAGCAPRIKLRATHSSVLERVDLEVLELYAITDS